MKRSILLIMAATSFAPWSIPTARAQDNKLTVVQDESSMEQIIERYLKANHQMTVNEKVKGDDLWLELPMKGETTPPYRFLVDTQPLNKDSATGRVIERGVRIQTLTGIKVSATRRDAVIRVINDFNRDKVFAAAYVDSDTEIMLDWTLNVLEPAGLDTEYVYDVLAREAKLWRELYPLVNAAMQE
jgi:Putative bacterial sensory transduction regulator